MKHVLTREYLIPNKYIGCICYCPSHKTDCSASLNNGIAICSLCGETFEINLREQEHVHTIATKEMKVGSERICRTIETYCSECGKILKRDDVDDHDFIVISLKIDKDTLKCAHCGFQVEIDKNKN